MGVVMGFLRNVRIVGYTAALKLFGNDVALKIETHLYGFAIFLSLAAPDAGIVLL